MKTSLSDALRRSGLLSPRDGEELEAFKAAAKKHFPPLPEHLRDPWSFRAPRRRPLKLPASSAHATDPVDYSMAMAARNGGSLPPDVLEKLKRNSEEARRKKDR